MNDEKRQENREGTLERVDELPRDYIVYGSLIVAAVMLAVMLIVVATDEYGFIVMGLAVPAAMVLVAASVISLLGLFVASWSGRRRFLLWCACLVTAILISQSVEPGEPEESILILGVVVLLVLPVVWLWNAVKTPNDRPQPSINARSMGDDNQGFEFAKALYLARKVDREAAQTIEKDAEARLVGIDEATALLLELSRQGDNS